MFTFGTCVEHLLYSLVVSCLKLDHKHFEAGTTSSCVLLLYLGPTVMDVELTGSDCNNKNNPARNPFVLIKKCATLVIRTISEGRVLKSDCRVVITFANALNLGVQKRERTKSYILIYRES